MDMKKDKNQFVDMKENDGVQNYDIEGNEEDSIPPSSPFSFSSSSSSISRNSGSPPKKTKIIREIYKASRRVLDEDLINFALFVDADPISFEDASQEVK